MRRIHSSLPSCLIFPVSTCSLVHWIPMSNVPSSAYALLCPITLFYFYSPLPVSASLSLPTDPFSSLLSPSFEWAPRVSWVAEGEAGMVTWAMRKAGQTGTTSQGKRGPTEASSLEVSFLTLSRCSACLPSGAAGPGHPGYLLHSQPQPQSHSSAPCLPRSLLPLCKASFLAAPGAQSFQKANPIRGTPKR